MPINKPIFFEEGHKYINPSAPEKKYISVTTLLHLFEPPKDWHKIAQTYVNRRSKGELLEELHQKYGIPKERLLNGLATIGPVETVKACWKYKNKKSTTQGSLTHRQKELQDLAVNSHFIREGIFLPLGINAEYVEDLYQLPDGVYPELLVYNNKYSISGKADKVVIETINGTRYIDILDYKTNEEIKNYNYINKRTGDPVINEMLLGPLKCYCNCNYWIYQLQLNMYAWLLCQFGFKFRGGAIIHTRDDDKEYQLLNLQFKIKELVEYYESTNLRNS